MITTTGKLIKYYRNLGYDAFHKKSIEVKITDLTNGSECIVSVSCDICQTKIVKTCIEKYGVENISQLDIVKELKIETCLRNHYVTNPSFSKEIIKKIQETTEKIMG